MVTIPAGTTAGQLSIPIQLLAGTNGATFNNLKQGVELLCSATLASDGTMSAINPGCGGVGPFWKNSKNPYGILISSFTVQDANDATINLAATPSSATSADPSSSASGCSIAFNGNTLTCTSSIFAADMVNHSRINLPTCGSTRDGKTDRMTTISGYTSPTTVTVAGACLNPSGASGFSTPVNYAYGIVEILYAPPTSQLATDPSNVAFAKYAQWMAQYLANAGVAGHIEFWNEQGAGYDWWPAPNQQYDYAFLGAFSATAIYGSG